MNRDIGQPRLKVIVMFVLFIITSRILPILTNEFGSSTPQDTNCTATCPLSRKLFKLDEPDMQDTAGEAEMNS